jgi:hypothetical protein
MSATYIRLPAPSEAAEDRLPRFARSSTGWER